MYKQLVLMIRIFESILTSPEHAYAHKYMVRVSVENSLTKSIPLTNACSMVCFIFQLLEDRRYFY